MNHNTSIAIQFIEQSIADETLIDHSEFDEVPPNPLHQLSESEYLKFKFDMLRLNDLTPRLARIDCPLFETGRHYSLRCKKAERYYRKPQPMETDNPIHHHQLAVDFLYGIDQLNRVLNYYPFNELPLYVDILAECIDQYDLWDFPTDLKKFNQDEVNALNECIYTIQQVLRDDAVRAELKQIKRRQRNQKQSIRQYIDQLLRCYARLEVIRIDLSYAKDAEICYAKVLQHCQQLTRYLRIKHEGNAHAGFIWKLEYGLRKGYHLHMMIFLDGSKVQQSILHGKKIGEHWTKAITNGLGFAYNCNAKMDDYTDCGIGQVNYYDQTKLTSLISASHYLTKHDPYIEIMQEIESARALEDGKLNLSRQIFNGRVLGMGALPKLRGRGRRRSYPFI